MGVLIPLIYMLIFLLFFGFFGIFLLCVLLFDYVISGITLGRIAKQTDACKPGLAWIPFVQAWVRGKCAEACEVRCGQKQHHWGKLLLILTLVHLGCVIFILPIGIILSMFGGSFLINLLSYVTVAVNVVTWICAYKIYHYYLGDPTDIILTLLHTQLGYTDIGLLIASFVKPRGVIEVEMPRPKASKETYAAHMGAVIDVE
jgi:hypothetical protein